MRLLELRAQLTIAVHGILQHSNATGSAIPDKCVWLHTMHSGSLRPFLQILVGVPTASALSHLVEWMERRESTASTAANRETGVHERERSPKRQRRSYVTADENESLDDSSSNMLDFSGTDKETAGLKTKTNALLGTDFCKENLNATAGGSLGGVDNCPSWTLLADFLSWSTFASHLLFQDIDVSTVNRQTAADFLGWLMCPSSPEGRAYATSEFLHAAEDWQSLCNEVITKATPTFRSPVVALGLSDLKNNGKENFRLPVCNFCGSPVNCSGALVNGAPHHVSNSSAFQNLVAWLLRFCSLRSQLQQLNLKGQKSVSKHQSYVDGMWEVIRVIPIASLSSDLSFLTPEVGGLLLSMILLGLTSGSKEVPTAEKSLSPRSCCTVCDDFHCVSCCYKDQHKSSEPPHRTEQIKNDARVEEDFGWTPFAAALFIYLDTNTFVSSAEPLTPASGHKVVVKRVVAACVHHWVRLTNQSTVMMNSQNVETVYHRRIQILEDLYTRILAWTNVTGDDTELTQAVENLTQQIEQFKTFL